MNGTPLQLISSELVFLSIYGISLDIWIVEHMYAICSI